MKEAASAEKHFCLFTLKPCIKEIKENQRNPNEPFSGSHLTKPKHRPQTTCKKQFWHFNVKFKGKLEEHCSMNCLCIGQEYRPCRLLRSLNCHRTSASVLWRCWWPRSTAVHTWCYPSWLNNTKSLDQNKKSILSVLQ